MTSTEHLAIAKITDTFLGAGERSHGVLTATLTVDYGGTSQSVGNYSLGGKTAFGIQFVARILRAAGVSSWRWRASSRVDAGYMSWSMVLPSFSLREKR